MFVNPGTATDQVRVVIVSGSRTWPWYKLLTEALDLELMRAMREGKVLTVRHGDAKAGGDHLAAVWCRNAHRNLVENIREQACPVAKGVSPKYALAARNDHMIKLRPEADQVLAFLMRCQEAKCGGRPVHGTHGTTDLINKAARAGIRTMIFRDPSLPQIIEARKSAEEAA